ncbi:MAG: Ldh family oxidoreductase [Chloroflexi bacterium]|nr:Ldh family oxidoreductase [Chloroflexota bacterium]
MSESNRVRVQKQALNDFCVEVFQKVGVADQDARLTADILVAADARGIASHGVAHLRRYVDGLRAGTIAARPAERVVTETPVTAVIDARAGLGQPVSYRAMQKAIQKAREVGVGFVSVRNSNHHGIVGYYAMMALPHDCIGLAMTNASPKVMPTFGRKPTLGTNPIAIAAPAGAERPFVLDMATSAVALGKIEIAEQLDKPVPEGWAMYRDGTPATDSHRAMDEFKRNLGAGLLSLGGAGELLGGHKGFGLAISVEIFTALLSSAAPSPLTYPKTPDGKPLPANVGHFFGAWRIDCFRPVDEFKIAMDDYQQLLKNVPKVPGQDRIYIHGEKEFEAEERNRRDGIPINNKVAADLRALAQELQVKFDS